MDIDATATRREWAPASGPIPARAWHHDRWHLTSVHLHIPGAAELKHRPGKGQVRSLAAGSSQLAGPWVPAWGPQCSGGTCSHAGPRVPSQLMALEIGASAALEQPENFELEAAAGPGPGPRPRGQ